jgi:hypothetical protein
MEWWRVAQTATFTPGAAYYPGQYEALPSDPRAALLQPRGVIFTVVDPNMWDGGFRCSDYGNLPSYATNPSCLGLTVYGSGGQPDHIYVVKGEWKALPMGNLKGQAAVAAYEMQNSIYHSLGGNMDGR